MFVYIPTCCDLTVNDNIPILGKVYLPTLFAKLFTFKFMKFDKHNIRCIIIVYLIIKPVLMEIFEGFNP